MPALALDGVATMVMTPEPAAVPGGAPSCIAMPDPLAPLSGLGGDSAAVTPGGSPSTAIAIGPDDPDSRSRVSCTG